MYFLFIVSQVISIIIYVFIPVKNMSKYLLFIIGIETNLWFFSWKMWMIVRKPSKIEVVIGLIIEILCADITELISINLLKFRISRDRFRSCKRYISRLVHRWQGITYGSGYKAINVLLFLLF